MNPNQTQSRTTLIAIDDSVTMRKVFQMTFAGENIHVITAGSAQDALSQCRQHQPQLALIDISLDGTSGYELCRTLKSEFKMPVILLSSKQTPYDSAQGQSCGADEHLDKPYDTAKTIELITKVLQQPASAPTTADTKPAVPVTATTQQVSPKVQTPQATPIQQAAPKPVVTPSASAVVSIPNPPVSSTQAALQTPAQVPVQASTVTNLPKELTHKLQELGLSSAQVEAVLALSREVVEKVVWEVVPVLAETMIKEEITRLTRE